MENADIIEVLNDLILINNDRSAGYAQAGRESKEIETDLRAMFSGLAAESDQHASDLKAVVERLGGEPATGTMMSGKLYRVWMDIRTMLSTDNRGALLSNAEAGEDSAVAAYEHALDENDLPDDIYEIISAQKRSVDAAHDTIKKQRDEQKEVSRYPLTS